MTHPTQPGVALRIATAADADAIAALHADSWRRHYRGALTDDFLDNEVEADRRSVWRERLGATRPAACTIVAERREDLVGFVHVMFDDDSHWGALVDNLHVRHDEQRSGLGRRLMVEAARRVVEATSSGLWLWVLEQNESAQAFYSALGGRCVERQSRHPEPGHKLRFHWPAPQLLLEHEGFAS